MRIVFATLGLLLATPALAQTAASVSAAIDATLGDHRAFEAAFFSIQGAVAEGDAESVASWVSYPITVTAADGSSLTLEDEDQFAERYSAFMTDDIVDAVATQDYADLFVNSDGVMFGNGEMWLSGICEDDACTAFEVRIVTIQSTSE